MGGSVCHALAKVEADSPRLVIKGTTVAGAKFRPSDWAQRLAGAAGTRHSDGRFRFNPLVRIEIVDGTTAVVVDGNLARTNPHLYMFLRKFGCLNNLQISE
ncbi:MAG TPA: DUF3579 domain-containing protein [Gammaproteobacteria bacterium]|jgi:hypothetical protein